VRDSRPFWDAARSRSSSSDSLKRLEYRGSDSAVFATLEGNKLDRRRAEGKLKNLEKRTERSPASTVIPASAIPAGPRTEGPPRTTPIRHATERVAVVHNGIIENFRELREALEKKGAVFPRPQTDTEIVLHLVDNSSRTASSRSRRVRAALSELRGAFRASDSSLRVRAI